MITFSNIVKSEGGTEPVVLADVKAWIQVDFTDFDVMLTSMLTGARKTIEGFTNLKLVETGITMDVETTKCNESVFIPYSYGAIGDIGITKLDDVDAETDLVAGTDFYQRGNNIRVPYPGRYAFSYTTNADNIPEDLKEAIKMEVAERFANRGENQAMRANYDSPSLGISEAAKSKARPYIQAWL